MSWNNLKSGVNAIVKTNGNQEITGANMQNVLGTIIDSLGANATFAGVATPSTAPGTPDGPVFYLAGQHGRYSNFGNVRFDTSNAIAIFVWDGSTWSKTELEFTVEGGGGGGGGGGGTDIDPSIATFTSSKVTIKVPLDVWDEATFTKIFVGDDNLDVEDILTQLFNKTSNISVSTSATTGEDIVDIETDVLIEGDLEVLDDVLIHKTVTINDGDGEVFIESGVVSADGIEANAISAGIILLNRVDLGTTLTALNTKIAGISRTTSGNTNTTVVADNLEVSGGLQTGGSATIGGSVNCDDIFCGLVEAAGFVTDGGLNIVSELTDIAALVDAIKEAQGEEVGDATTTAIGAGVLIWHNGYLYKTNSPIPSGTTWANMDVVQTTVSAEINALRGVAVESVVLNITPTSAIPAAGVKARIYNVTTQTYMPEVTFTPNFNRALLGVVNFGDVYTIIMPSIDGYTQPGNQTFQANQMLRDRTVEYIDASVPTSEALVIRAATSNGSPIGAYNAVVRLYNGQGAITQTINVSIEGGISQVVNIPFGTRYSVTYPVISGYYTPKNQTEIITASTANRYLNASYVFIPTGAYQWVIYDGTNIEYIPMDADLTSYVANNTLFGAAFLDSSLVRSEADGGDCRFIMPLGMTELTNKRWSFPDVDVPSVQNTGGRTSTAPNMFNGVANSRAVLDAILQYEIDNNVTVESVFKELDQGITLGGDTVKMFIPAWNQQRVAAAAVDALNTALGRFSSSKTFPTRSYMSFRGFTSLQFDASKAYKFLDGYDGSVNKGDVVNSVFAFLPIISVTQSNS